MWISILVNFIPVIIAIVIHEVAHGYAAYLLGDDTAKRCRRLSLNPLRHVDVFGTLLLPALLLLSNAGFLFGWAKPVPVDFSRLRHHRRDTVIVASAGIAANLLLALICALLLPLMTYISAPLVRGIATLFMLNLVAFNIVLAVFNALPVPPLDGSKILLGWSDNPRIQKFLNAYREGTAFIIIIAFIIPALTTYFFNWNFNPFASYLVKTSKYLMSFFI